MTEDFVFANTESISAHLYWHFLSTTCAQSTWKVTQKLKWIFSLLWHWILWRCNLTWTKCGFYQSNAQESLSQSGNKHSGILCRPDVPTMRWHAGEERKNPSPLNLAYFQGGLLFFCKDVVGKLFAPGCCWPTFPGCLLILIKRGRQGKDWE